MFFDTLAPKSCDTEWVSLNKSIQLFNLLNGGASSTPTYFPEGSESKRLDTKEKILQKITGATAVYSGKA